MVNDLAGRVAPDEPDVDDGSAVPAPFRGRNILMEHSAQSARGQSTIGDVLCILAQAQTAAQLYERLSRQCDAALAEQGLTRADLPRVTYDALTNGY